ncbi:hypothetical protein Tco_0930279, partial [Tanacetum coccineum]
VCMMNSGSGNIDQVAVGVVDESDIDFESWINELKSDDSLEFILTSRTPPVQWNLTVTQSYGLVINHSS